MRRRSFVQSAAALAVASKPICAAEEDPAFDPDSWLRQRKLGRLTLETPQSGKPLQPIAARTLGEWEKERLLYESALRELIGSWPQRRPALGGRVLEEKTAEHWTRYKVSFSSLPSTSDTASQIRAWLFVPHKRTGKLPAVVTLHQTLPQGKDEPAGIKGPHPWMYLAPCYAERGYVALAPDMVGYGERTRGGYARTGFEYSDAAPILDAHPHLTLLGLMLYDVSRAVDYLETRPEVDAGRIGVIGHSQGGILVNMVLGLEPRLKAGVASCGYGLFRKDKLFPQRWAAKNSAYLPRLHLYQDDPLSRNQGPGSAPRAPAANGDGRQHLDASRRGGRRLHSQRAATSALAIFAEGGQKFRFRPAPRRCEGPRPWLVSGRPESGRRLVRENIVRLAPRRVPV
jgi:dienelactone hydrolase